MTGQPEIASLWIGNSIGWIERMCLASFLAQGHSVTLFSYAPIQNVPPGITKADARDIWTPPDDVMRQTGAAYLADLFRIHLMRETDMIWVDTDALCIRPFQADADGYLIGYNHGRSEIANGVLRLPKSSAALQFLSEIWSDPDFLPPWIRPALRQRLQKTPREERLVKRFHLKRTIMGPRALTAAVQDSGEIERAVDESVLYPVPWWFSDLAFNPHGGVDGWVTEDTISLHLYTSQIRGPLKNKFAPHPDSFIGRELAKLADFLPE